MVSEVAGEVTAFFGGEAFLGIGERFRIGGFGYGTLESTQLVGGPAPEELSMGYGGIFVGLTLADPGLAVMDGELLVGAGNAQVRAQPVGNQLGSDNYLVIEPRLTLELPRHLPLRGTLKAGYRFVTGVQDLPRVATGDLGSWTVALQIVLSDVR